VRAAATARPGDAELAASGAASAAAALAGLVGGGARAGRIHAPAPRALAACEAGAFFAVAGALEGAVAVLFPPAAREGVLAALGAAALADPGSALSEVANIVASQAVCAIGERLGARMHLSVPRLEPRGAGAALARAIGDGAAFASELGAGPAGARVLLVLFRGATPSGCDTVAG
jgi:hypothetical protein